jgi:hypothetical protein
LLEKNDVGGLSPQSQSDKPRVWAEPSVTIPTTSANAEISHFILSEILTEDQNDPKTTAADRSLPLMNVAKERI